jgi:hypothetical protein
MGVRMRGDDEICGSLFSYIDLEERVRADHPLRAIREIVNAALVVLSRDFAALYSGMGRPSIAPEKLLRAMAPSVIAIGRSAKCRIMSSAANRSAWPETRVSLASVLGLGPGIRPERFSISPCPMKHNLASMPGPLR